MIYDQKLEEGSKLPSERELAELFKVNRKTLRNAISALCNEGILYTVQGKGTFIAPPKYRIRIDHSDCLRDALANSKYHYTINNIYEKMMIPKDYAILAFKLDENEALLTQLNIIYIEKEPIAYETVYIKEENPQNTYKKRIKFSLSKSTEEESLFLGISKKSDVIVERTYECLSDDHIVKSFSTVIVANRITFYKNHHQLR